MGQKSMKTIGQIAKILGVSRQAIYRRLSTMPTIYLSTDSKGVQRINAEGEAFLRDKLSANLSANCQPDSPADNSADNTIIAILREQIEKQDIQLKAQAEQIDGLLKAIDQEQQLHMITKQEMKLLAAPKRRWWQRREN